MLTAEFAAEVQAQRQALAAIDQAAARGAHGPAGLNPAWLVLKLREHLNDDATVTTDMGTNYIHMARHFRVYQPRHLMFSNGQQIDPSKGARFDRLLLRQSLGQMSFEIVAHQQLIPGRVLNCIEAILLLDYVAGGGAIKLHS